MSLIAIGEHTIDESLLTPGGWVLDAGCRDFTFSRGMVARGCKVLALDADPTVEDQKIDGVTFLHSAIAAKHGLFYFHMHENPEARSFVSAPVDDKSIVVTAHTIEELMQAHSVERFDAVKLDVEGAEYDILRNWPGPIARQISIEFHEHVAPRPQGIYDEIFKHLGQHYDVIQHEKTARHCTHPNWWDTLLTLRESV